MADAFDDFQFDHFLPHEPETPALDPLRFRATEQRHQVRFGFSIQFAFLGPRRLGTAQEGSIESLLAKALADTLHRTPADGECLDDLRGRPARTERAAVHFEQNLGMGDGPGRTLASAYDLFQASTLHRSQHDAILFHWGLLVFSTEIVCLQAYPRFSFPSNEH